LLILALDPPTGVDAFSWSMRIAEEVGDLVHGVKIGLPLVLDIGLQRVGDLLSVFKGIKIADLKLADIGDVMCLTLERLASIGIDAVIAHAFVGFRGAIDKLSSRCRELGVKLILVVSMSHPGSSEIMDEVIDKLVDVARRACAWGVVAPATRLDVVRYVRSQLPEAKILCPGVGVQGASPGDALCAGADYEIVGRLITRSDSPRRSALEVLEMQRKKLAICRR